VQKGPNGTYYRKTPLPTFTSRPLFPGTQAKESLGQKGVVRIARQVKIRLTFLCFRGGCSLAIECFYLETFYLQSARNVRAILDLETSDFNSASSIPREGFCWISESLSRNSSTVRFKKYEGHFQRMNVIFQQLFLHSRGEEAAAEMKVGVRELGNILLRERDMLVRERNPLRGRTASLPSSFPTQRERSDFSGGEPNEIWCDPGYQLEGQEMGSGSDKTARLDNTELVPQEDVAQTGGLASGKGRDLTQESGVGEEVSGGVSEGVSEAGLRRREALRSKLGHLIFMAPDEDVERFRHTARRWTRGLRNRVSDQNPGRHKPRSPDGDQAPGLESPRIAEGGADETPALENRQTHAAGASERVKEEVRRTLEKEGPDAMQEAAKRGAKQLDKPCNILKPPSRFHTLQGGINFPVEPKLRSVDGVIQTAFRPPLSISQSVVTPRFSAWQATLGGGIINSLGPLEPPGSIKTEHETRGGFKWVCPSSSSPNVLDTIYSGKALDLAPRPSAKAHFQHPDTLNPQTPICAECPNPSLPRAQSTPVVLSTDADSPLDDDVIPPLDDVTSTELSGRTFSDMGNFFSGSVRATSPSSSTSSQAPSRCGRPCSSYRFLSFLLLYPVHIIPFLFLFPVYVLPFLSFSFFLSIPFLSFSFSLSISFLFFSSFLV
jgi:hypothetical protein